MFDFNRWIRQPTTLHALGVIAAGIGAALTHVAIGNPAVSGAVGVAAYVAVHLGIDDHSAAEQAVMTGFTDMADVINHPADLPAKAPILIADAAQIAKMFTAPPAPAPVAAAVPAQV